MTNLPHQQPSNVPATAVPSPPYLNGHPHQNGSPPPHRPSPSPAAAGPGGRRRSALGRRAILFGFLVLVVGTLGAGVWFLAPSFGNLFSSFFATKRPDLLTHTVKSEYLDVKVVERGTLESAENKEVLCQVKAGQRGTYATTIKWVIDDGSLVNKGTLLMELDDSALQDTYRTQSIAVEKAYGEWVTADEDYTIQVKQNESDIATAVAALAVAELDLDKYLGLRADPTLDVYATVAGALGTLVERGEYRQLLDDVSGRLKLAESDLEAYRDRSSWADRQVRLGNLTPSQAKVEQSKLAAGLDNVEKLQKEKYILETFLRQRNLTDYASKVEVARLGLIRSERQAMAKLNQFENSRKTKYSVYQQEADKLREVEEQIRACKIYAPQDGMVVYYKDSSSRWSSSQEGMIQQGAQVKEGQKLMRIPDLRRMMVNTKVHEALVSRVRGDDRQSTGFLNTLRAGLLATPHGMTRLLTQSEFAQATLRDAHRDKEYYLASRGQEARVRVDAVPNRLLKGHVRSVAAVASQADYFSSDVKVYQTYVTIDEEVAGLKPDMSAEVTIVVDPPEKPVLAVPVQAIVGGAEGGTKRRLFVLTPTGPEEREITLGMFNEKMVEVQTGIREGDQVVLNPKVLLGDASKTREENAGDAGRRPGAGGPGAPGGGAGAAGGAGGEKKGKGNKGAGGFGGAKGGPAPKQETPPQ